MIRNLEALGLALVALLAMSAMTASAAQAVEHEGKLTSSEYPVTVHGTGNLGDFFEAFGGAKVTCQIEPHYTGTLTGASTSISVTPEYTQTAALPCTGAGQPATVTHNGCTFKFYDATTTDGAHTYGVKTDIICPAGKVIEVHIYATKAIHEAEHTKFTMSEPASSLCTITVKEQKGLTGFHLTQDTGTPKDLTLSGTLTNIHAEIHRNSILCPKGPEQAPGTTANTTDPAAKFVIASPITITAKNGAGVQKDLDIEEIIK